MNTVMSVIEAFFGEYHPLTDSSGDIILGNSGINFQWIACVVIFLVFLISVFKLLGVLLKK